MKEISKENQEFLQGVFAKARYLEYLKVEDEIVKENCKRIRRTKIKATLTSLIIAALLIFIGKITDFNFGVVWLLSLMILTLACFYEYREEKSLI